MFSLVALTLAMFSHPVYAIVDESASMSKYDQKKIASYIQSLPATIFWSFSDRKVHENVKLKALQSLPHIKRNKVHRYYKPFGSSPLYDAIVKSAEEISESATIIIVSDMEDTESKHTKADAQQSIAKRADLTYLFVKPSQELP